MAATSRTTVQETNLIDFYEKSPIPNNLPERTPLSHNLSNKLCVEISNLEIHAVIKELGKTLTGIDGVPNLLVKTLEDFFLPFLNRAFNAVLNNTENFHQDMKLAYVKLIP